MKLEKFMRAMQHSAAFFTTKALPTAFLYYAVTITTSAATSTTTASAFIS